MSNYGVKIPRWNPSRTQMEVFQEWRKITIQHLVSCRKGILPYKLPGMLQEVVDERLPLDKMGLEYRNVNHFLYQLRNDIVLRRVDGKIFVFINESSVPEEMLHIRQMVLGQKGKDDKPLRHHGVGVEAEELLQFQPRQFVSVPSLFSPRVQNRVVMPVQFPGIRYNESSDGRPGPSAPPRSDISPIQSIVAKTMAAKGLSNAATRRIPRVDILDDNDNWHVSSSATKPITRPAPQPTTFRRYLPGIDDNESSSDSDEFDFYSGSRKSPPPLPLAPSKTLTTQEEMKTGTTQQEKKTLTATLTSATVVLQPENVPEITPSTASELMQSNPPLTENVPRKMVWGKNQLMARMKAIMERTGKDLEVSVLQPTIVNRDAPVTVSGQNIPPSNGTQTESVCNAPKISEEPEPSSASVNSGCGPLPKATPSKEQLPDYIRSKPDIEVNYGYTVEEIYPYERERAGVPPRTYPFNQVVELPTYLMDHAPRTLKGFLVKAGQLEKYVKSLE